MSGAIADRQDVLDVLFGHAAKDVPPAHATGAGATIPEGRRNDYLTKDAGRLRRLGLSGEAINAALQVINVEHCHPPLPTSEVEDIARSVSRYPSGEDPATAHGAQLLSESDLAARPVVPDLVTRMLPAEGVGAIIGPPGSGKTFLAIGLGLAVPSGRDFHGAAVTIPGPAVLVAGEGVARLPSRIPSWKREHGFSVADNLGLLTYPDAVQLADPLSVAHLIDLCLPVHPRLVLLDTLARCSVGLEENSARDMGRAIAGLDTIRRALACCVLVLHHTTKNGSTERGSSALRGALDVMWALDRPDPQGPAVTLSCEKSKDGVPFDPIALALAPVGDSCVLRRAGLTDGRAVTLSTMGVWTVLHETFGSGGATAGEWQRAASRYSERTFYRARTTLIERGYVGQSGQKYLPVSAPTSEAV